MSYFGGLLTSKKLTMKKIRTSILVLTVLSIIGSCKKGDQGPAGTNGTNGNANVAIYTFGSQTFTGSYNYILTGISQGRIDSSLVLAYYNPAGEAATSWYPVPGPGSGGLYEVRSFFYQSNTSPSTYTFGVRLMNAGAATIYGNPVTFTKFKIVIAPASSITAGSRVAPDLKHYSEVRAVYGLGD